MSKNKAKTKAENRAKRLLIAIVSAFIAIALGATCALWFGNSAKPVSVNGATGDVTASANRGALTGNQSGWNSSGVPLIAEGDMMEYTYNGGRRSITLPKGTYKFEVWGAQGGGGYQNGVFSAGVGLGGYSQAQFTLKAATTVYIVVGGVGANGKLGVYGANSWAAGGYNGGGNSGKEMNSDANDEGGGGGGATHIALADGVLSGLSSAANQKHVMIVAGGGGGTSFNRAAGKGYGGGTTGGTGYGGSRASTGGTQSQGGVGGTHGEGTDAYGRNGGFGQGGVGGNGTSGGGGGGGGWYGGAGGPCGSVGGGGSGFIRTSGFSNANVVIYNAGGMQNGKRSGHGLARITAVKLNDNPVTINANGTTPKIYEVNNANYYKGVSRSLVIKSSEIARDPDPANVKNGNANQVYFSQGASNRQTAPANNNHLYLNSACTTLASNYFSWEWSGGTSCQTLTIKEIKRYPRKGVDGCTADGVITLYARVRDNYYSSTKHGLSVIPFQIRVRDNAITNKGDGFLRFSKTGYEYRYGNRTMTSGGSTYNFAAANNTQIYNPVASLASNIKTLFISTPLTPTDTAGFTVYASDIYTDADNHSTYGDYVAIKSVAAYTGYTGYSSYYSITYNSNASYASGLVPSFTIKPTGVRPNGPIFVCMTITAQTSEKHSKAAIGGTNSNVMLVFQIANTRPYFATTSGKGANFAEPYIELNLNTKRTQTLDISQIVFDTDDAKTANKLTFARGANDLKIPTNEYIQVNRVNAAVPLLQTYNSKTSNYYGKTSVQTSGTLSSASGEGTTSTGFKKDLIAQAGSSGATYANVTYSYDGDKKITFTARSATQYQYDTAGRLGDFYILVRIIDATDTTDGGLWYPVAVKVNSAAPVEPSTVANFSLNFDRFKADSETQEKENGIILTPISYTDENGVLQGIGSLSTEYSLDESHTALPFVVDPDTFMYDGENVNKKTHALNDIIMLAGVNRNDSTDLSKVVELFGTSEFFTVELVDLYASKTVFSRLEMYDNDALLSAWGVEKFTGNGSENGFKFKGLKIVPRRSTDDTYLQFNVNVKDSHDQTSKVRVCINVRNREVQLRNSPNGSSMFKINTMAGYGTYLDADSSGIGVATVNYEIEIGDEIQITPYDFAYDYDVDPENVKLNNPVNNTNPVDAGFDAAAAFILASYNIPHTTSPTAPAGVNDATSFVGQQLRFVNIDNFNASASQYASYISARVADKTVVKPPKNSGGQEREYAIPCIKIEGLSRTTSAVVMLRFTIGDGYSNQEVMITVTVKNSKPMLNTEENHPKTNPNDKRITMPYNLSADPANAVNIIDFDVKEAAYDKDGDTLTFKPNSVKVVAYDENGEEQFDADGKRLYYYDALDANFKGVPSTSADAVYLLSDYVEATLTKNGSGVDVVRVKGLSSTELFNKQIFVQFTVQDGYRAQPQEADLRILINVVNSAPVMVTDGLAEVQKTEDGVTQSEYTWLIGYEDIAETKISRFIVNSKELCESSAINVSSANKIWLFDDADAQQRVLLDPQGGWNLNGNWAADLIKKQTLDTPITQETFALTENAHAAIIYGKTYSGEDADKQHLELTLHFYGKNKDGFYKIENTSENIKTAKYWALEIKDVVNKTNAAAAQIAIAVKDDHHGNDLYNAEKTETFTRDSSFRVLNFSYGYKQPGIMNMHTYYRTDGNAEAKVLLDPNETVEANKRYQVDINGFNTDRSYQFVGSAPATQAELQDATFAPRFTYQYFVKTQIDGDSSTATYKHYPDSKSAFYYEPIEVTGALSGKVDFPISYLAMPQGSTAATEGSTHVTFANATQGTLNANNKLLDSQYDIWCAEYNPNRVQNLEYILENVTVSDGKTIYTAKDNPYLNIEYIANTQYISSKYRNANRYSLSSGGFKAIDPIDPSSHSSIYREDKFGFRLSKKENGPRAAGMLKLSVALKTTTIVLENGENKVKEGATEIVDVEINLQNSKPTVQYNDVQATGMIDNLNVEMTTADVNGKTVGINHISLKSSEKAIGDYKIYYEDPDKSDTMKFYLPSAFGKMSAAEVDHIASGTNISGLAEPVKEYFNGTPADKYTYNPNVGYEKFFDVLPSEGSAATLQFVPKAKTQPNLAVGSSEFEQYVTDNHLAYDANDPTKKLYYPFRVLFYDEVSGTPFTDGYWCLAIIKVYINNDPIRVNSTAIGDNVYIHDNVKYPNYTFKLSKATSFYLDVSSLLVDNDIVLNGTSMAVKTDAAWTNADRNVKDYLVMPDPTLTSTNVIAKPSSITTLPITVAKGGTGLTDTTLVFNATCAFKGDIVIKYTFADSVNELTGNGGSSVTIVFTVQYNNENPTANNDTFGGGSSMNIVMKQGDSITLYASDSTLFANDANGGFKSYGLLKQNAADRVSFPFGKTEQSAQEMLDDFNGKQAGDVDLGSLVIGGDDAPTTLRFSSYDDATSFKQSNVDDRRFFDIVVPNGAMFERENSAQRSPVAVTLTAKGVVNTIYSLELIDGEGSTVRISININVQSSAPRVKTGEGDETLPKGLTLDKTAQTPTFIYEMSYGESREFLLKDFMHDDDLDDANEFKIAENADKTKFTIVGGSLGAEATGSQYDASITLNALDVITDKGDYATVSFRVEDAHGVTSEIITIKVLLTPSEVSVVATERAPYATTLKSYAEYIDDGEPVTVDLVSAVSAVLFKDADAPAASAKYDVAVYALLRKDDKGVINAISSSQLIDPTTNDYDTKSLLLTLTDSTISTESNDVAAYVARYFRITISADGKQLILTPNSATIQAGTPNLKNIRLLITLAKRYKDGTLSTLPRNVGFADIAVKNSELVAVESSPINYGYPEIKVGETETRRREQGFLEFTGTAGDSLTWDLYNILDPELGLFYDYDMINYPAESGGLEKIRYVRSEYSVSESSQHVQGKGNVLSIDVTEDGKLTIKINRKVYRGEPPVDGLKDSYTEIPVKIYCADAIGFSYNEKRCVATEIKVRVDNDIPEIKPVTDADKIEQLGYSVTYSDTEGYVLEAKLEKGATLPVNIADIIDDADLDMDAYVLLPVDSSDSLMGSDKYLSGSVTTDGVNDGIGRIKNSNGDTLMSVRLSSTPNAYGVTALRRITFTCESAQRGAVAVCKLQIRDSVAEAKTSILTVRITVDNVAPSAKPDVKPTVTVMGVGLNADAAAIADATVTLDILDYVTDVNGDAYDPTDASNASKRATYVFIDEILVYTTEDIMNKPEIYGPGLDVDISDENYTPIISVCAVDWWNPTSGSDENPHQKFTITPAAGVYGKQKISLTVIDSGYEDGAAQGVLDGKVFTFEFTIIVANPLDDVADILPVQKIAYGVTRIVTVEDLLGEQNAQGYIIQSMEEIGTSSVGIYAPGVSQGGITPSATTPPSDEFWRIYGRTEGASVNAKVVFKAGEVVRERTLPIQVVPNQAPVFKGGKTSYEYTVSRLDDAHKRTIKIYPEDWFDDFDDGDIMSFVGPIESSQSVKVETLFDYDENGRAYILLTFNRRGEADITFNVSDLSGKLYKKTIKVNCTDAPEMSWWENFVSLVEANWMWFWIILACILLFIILLIILIIIIHKKRKMRREIEALLNSETELEEEMLRLSAGGAAPYQSFGYLPPTQTTVNNPNLMIGGGVNTPAPNSLQLNAGTGASPVGSTQQIPPPVQQPPQAQPQNMSATINPTQNVPPPPAAGNAAPPVGNDGFNPDDF